MPQKKSDHVNISQYAGRILYLQLKYGKRDWTGSIDILIDDVISMETRWQSGNHRGQTVDQYLDELEDDLETWE